jgi:hypothetical protein
MEKWTKKGNFFFYQIDYVHLFFKKDTLTIYLGYENEVQLVGDEIRLLYEALGELQNKLNNGTSNTIPAQR